MAEYPNPKDYAGPKGLFNITSTPLSILHQVANPELLSVPLVSDEPRTKTDRCTKVFVGRIPANVTDYFMEQLYLECGPVNSWQRMLDSSGKPLNWGFVEFQTVEGMLRCLRLLNGLYIKQHRLMCRIDRQTEYFIKEWADLKRSDWERKRLDNIMNSDPAAPSTFEDELISADKQILFNIQLIIHNLEQHSGNEIKDEETEEEHPREKERESRIKARNKDRERQFRETEKEWLRREEIKERERAKDREKEEDRAREALKTEKKDAEYESDDETRRFKYSKKFEKRREEKRIQRELEKEEDKANAEKEFKLMHPGVATTEEKLQQAKELEENINQEDHTLKDFSGLEINLKLNEERPVPSKVQSVFNVEEDTNELYKTTHKPLPIALPDEETPKPQPENTITQDEFDKQLNDLKNILKTVPRHRKELYPFPLKWNDLAQNRILDKKLGPFVAKLFIEYLGSDDHSLVQMVVRMVANREEPGSIEKKVEKFLEDDASPFVKRIWKMLVFEHMKLEYLAKH